MSLHSITINPNVLTFSDLQEITHCQRVGDVKRALDENGIRYFSGKQSVWTTIALVNAAGGIVGTEQESQRLL